MDPQTKALLVLGGTSEIGRATALAFAQRGWRVLLSARDQTEAARNAADIKARTGSQVSVHELDVLRSTELEAFANGLPVLPDVVVCVIGELGEQTRGQIDLAHATSIFRTNFEGPALMLGVFAERFLARGYGSLVGVSSVAGDRGRGSNYLYGAAKAGFTAFLSGLRNRMGSSNVQVLTIKPGFVRTRMTSGMKLPPVLTAEPIEVGEAIFAAVQSRRKDVVYVRRVWSPVMAAIRMIPEPIFKRLKL